MSDKKSGGVIATLFAVVAVVAVGIAVWGWLTVFKLGGSLQKMSERQKMVIPTMTVDAVVVKERPVVAPEKFIARVEAIESVNLVARVEGAIEKVHFAEGAEVKEGDLLFTIEDDRYKAELAVAKAGLSQAEATLAQAEKYYNRLKDTDRRGVSQADLDNAESSLLQAKAQIEQAKANIVVAELNLEYTKITSPISGAIGKNFFTVGNFVKPTSGTLAKIVQLDPIRVIFSTPDKTYIRAMNMQRLGNVASLVTTLKLPDGSTYSEKGEWSFVDNEMDSSTGTIAVRSLFKNPDNLLIPGGFVYIYVNPKDVKTNPVIPQSALLNDNDGYFVYAVDSDGQVSLKRIGIGRNSEGFVVVRSGLEAGEQVVVQGLQKVTPGQKVNVNLVKLVTEGEIEQ